MESFALHILLQLYSLQVTTLNSAKYYCRELISSGEFAVAWFKITFDFEENESSTGTVPNFRNASNAKSEIIATLHECIKPYPDCLPKVAMVGTLATAGNGNKMHLHVFFSSYVAEILETEYRISSERKSQPLLLCHNCFAAKNILHWCKNARRRNVW